MANRKKWTWEELVTILEKNKDKNIIELGKIFKKDKSWVSRLIKFYNASEEEKKELALQNKIFKGFYNLYIQYKQNHQEKKEKRLHQTLIPYKNLLPVPITHYKYDIKLLIEPTLKELRDTIKILSVELAHCEKLRKTLLKENAEQSITINYYVNHSNSLEEEKKVLETKLKYFQFLYIVSLIIGFSAVIIGVIKCQ